MKRLKKIFFFFFALFFICFAAGGIFIAYTLRNLPDPARINERQVNESTKIYDRTGKTLLYEVHGEEKRTVITLEDIPNQMRQATISVEDAGFYKHNGINYKGIVRALWVDLASKNLSQGGSSITQQLVKNSFLTSERSIIRKMKEAVLAIRLEKRYSKDDILEMYLNQIPYGSNTYGIQAASQTFFGVDPKDLTLGESALLASLSQAPSFYSPYGSHTDELMKRKDYVLGRMADLGYITGREADDAKHEKLVFLPPRQNILAPHFVMMVKDYLTQKYGEDTVESGGLVVTTTLDVSLQSIAERVIEEGAKRNETLIKAKNAALAAVNPKTGEVLTLVGSRDYFDIQHEGNFNVATALRQPGSAFKPFVYATAFKKGFTPDTVLFDVPTEFNPGCNPGATSTIVESKKNSRGLILEGDKCYHPGNYDEKFRGPVSLRTSLAQSINVTSVKLLYLAGANDSIQLARDMGITPLADPSRYGLSLVLGGAEVKLLEMVGAYGVFGNDGVLNPLTYILEVRRGDQTLEKKEDQPRPVLDTNIARIINDVLSDNEARIGVFQRNSSLYFPNRRVAVKTGTTQEYHDAWTIGFTPSLAAGVWVGNNNNDPIQQKGSGVLAAAPLWRAFMDQALATSTSEEFPKPEYQKPEKPILRGIWQGNTTVQIDLISKKLASSSTPQEFIDDVAVGDPHDILFWIDRSDPVGPKPEHPEDDAQYVSWEWAFQQWVKNSGFKSMSFDSLPKNYDDVHTPENRPVITIGLTTDLADTFSFSFRISSKFSLKVAEVSFGDTVIKSVAWPVVNQDYPINVPKKDMPESPTVSIKAYDMVGNSNEAFLTPAPQL